MHEDFTSKQWRLNNLYRIINKDGNSVPFRLNAVQDHFLASPHKRKITLTKIEELMYSPQKFGEKWIQSKQMLAIMLHEGYLTKDQLDLLTKT